MKQWPVPPCPHQHEANSISLSLIRALQGPHAASLRKTLVQLATITN